MGGQTVFENLRGATRAPFSLDIDQFQYQLPESLIAQQPCSTRTGSRLLGLDGQTGEIWDGAFRDLRRALNAGDLLVFNDTKVVPARLRGRKVSGGRVEILLERLLNDYEVLAQTRASNRLKAGQCLIVEANARKYAAAVVRREESFHVLRFRQPVTKVLDDAGDVPLPPYIRRTTTPADRTRYQTVYARRSGAVAAPTAGLHFDQQFMDQLAAGGVRFAFVTLHVGAGTFRPVRTPDPSQHRMHAEWVSVPRTVCDAVKDTRARGRRVVAVGTTSVRALETAARAGQIEPYEGDTDLFIYPGFQFKVVQSLLTNFHLPGSTLLMLVCAFAGIEQTMNAYRHAVQKRYRFYSYGDAMLITRPDKRSHGDEV